MLWARERSIVDVDHARVVQALDFMIVKKSEMRAYNGMPAWCKLDSRSLADELYRDKEFFGLDGEGRLDVDCTIRENHGKVELDLRFRLSLFSLIILELSSIFFPIAIAFVLVVEYEISESMGIGLAASIFLVWNAIFWGTLKGSSKRTADEVTPLIKAYLAKVCA